MAKRRKFIAGLGVLATGSAAAVGTGAFSVASANRDVGISVVDDSQGLLALEPGLDSDIVSTDSMGGGGPGKNYLSIDFDINGGGNGINPDSRYQLGISPETGDYTYDDNYKTEPDEYEDEHAFTVTNQDSEPKDITVKFNSNRDDLDTNTFGLVLVRNDGSVANYGGAFTSSGTIEHTAEDVGSGKPVYVVFGLHSERYMTGNSDMGGQITVEATST